MKTRLAVVAICLLGIFLASCRADSGTAMRNTGISAQSTQTTANTVEYDGVQYTQSGPPELLDILSSRMGTETQRLPVVICVHGGSWSGGSRGDMRGMLPWLASRGYCVCTIDYRLTPAAPFPAQIQDCKCAVRFLRAHADALHIDPDRIGVAGVSAGGHLALLLGLTSGVARLEGTGGWNHESSRVQCVFDMCGPTDFAMPKAGTPISTQVRAILEAFLGGSLEAHPALLAEASPINYVKQGEPPILIMHGDQDTLVPLSQSEELTARLKATGNDVTFKIARGVGHGNYTVFASPDNIAVAQDFFDRTLMKPK